MNNPQAEIERLSKNSIKTEEGTIFINKSHGSPSVELALSDFSGRRHGSLFMFSPGEWVCVVEVMREYFKNEEGKYSFGIYSGDDLKEIVEKYTLDVQNISFKKTWTLMELCIGILCKLTAEGSGTNINPKEIMTIWEKVNNKKEKGR